MTYKIPEKIVFYTHGKSTIERENSKGGKIKKEVFPAYIADAKSKTANKSGVLWARRRVYDSAINKWVAQKSKKSEQKNEPREGYRIFSCERRSNGGRAYKIITPDNYYIDLREDVLLDVILECGISAGGLLSGKFLFILTGSQMKLIREGSKLHKKATESNNLLKQRKIPIKDLQVGALYSNRSGETKIFLGHVVSTDLETIRQNYHQNPGGFFRYDEKTTIKRTKKGLLWFRCYNTNKKWDSLKPFTDIPSRWRFNITKTHSMIKKEHVFRNPPSIEKIQTIFKKQLKRALIKNKEESRNNENANYDSYSYLVNLKEYDQKNKLKNNEYYIDPSYKDHINNIIVEEIVDA